MNYEEAVAEVARRRGCASDELMICSAASTGTCREEVCRDVYALLQAGRPTVDERRAGMIPELAAPYATTSQSADPYVAVAQLVPEKQGSNPKTLMGNLKVPNLSVIPYTALIRMAQALEYGAYHAPRKDGGKGYGPFNWRDTNIEYMTYIEANLRHVASAADREDIDPDTSPLMVMHLGEAMATLAILIDAIEHGTVIDNRSSTARGRVAALLRELRKPIP